MPFVHVDMSTRNSPKTIRNGLHNCLKFCDFRLPPPPPNCGSQMNDPLPLPNAQELLNIYKIMKTLYHHDFNQNGSVATHARRDRLLTLNTNEPKSGQ